MIPHGEGSATVSHGASNFALNEIATPWYRAMIGGSILLGLEEAAKGEQK